MSLAILPEPISVSLFHHLVSQGPAAGCQVSLCYLCSEMGSLDLRQACSGPFSTCSISVCGDDSGVPGCEGFDDCSTGLLASGAPGLRGSWAPRLHSHALLLPASPRFGLVLVFPSFTFPTPRISGSLQHPFPALSLPKHPYRQHLGFCVRFRMTLGKEGGTSSGTCSRVTIVPGS